MIQDPIFVKFIKCNEYTLTIALIPNPDYFILNSRFPIYMYQFKLCN